MLRIFIFIFLLSSLASPVIAVACEMMNDNDMSSMNHDMSSMNHDMSSKDHDMSHEDMKTHMNHDHSCNSAACISVCTASFLVMSIDNQTTLTIKILNKYTKNNLLSLYQTFHPINTPPPLV